MGKEINGKEINGKEALEKNIKRKGRVSLFFSIVLIALAAIIAVSSKDLNDAGYGYMMALIIGVFGILLLFIAIDRLKGLRSKLVTQKENMLELIDDLYKTTVYQDSYIIVSDHALANKKDISQITHLHDVLAIYERVTRRNGAVVSRVIRLDLKDSSIIEINVPIKNEQLKLNLMSTISSFCPFAMVGYSDETNRYVAEKQKEYKVARGLAKAS